MSSLPGSLVKNIINPTQDKLLDPESWPIPGKKAKVTTMRGRGKSEGRILFYRWVIEDLKRHERIVFRRDN